MKLKKLHMLLFIINMTLIALFNALTKAIVQYDLGQIITELTIVYPALSFAIGLIGYLIVRNVWIPSISNFLSFCLIYIFTPTGIKFNPIVFFYLAAYLLLSAVGSLFFKGIEGLIKRRV